jgi:hypothetical protein
MTVERAPRPIGLPLGVNVLDDPRDLAPVGSVCIGIKHAEIRETRCCSSYTVSKGSAGARPATSDQSEFQSDCNTIILPRNFARET